MTMQTVNIKSASGHKVTVEYGWQTVEQQVWLDGHTATRQTSEFVLAMSVEGFGAARHVSLRPNGTIEGVLSRNGQQGKAVIKIDDELYEAITAERNKKRTRSADPLVSHPDYCPKCKSVCYGDCEAN